MDRIKCHQFFITDMVYNRVVRYKEKYELVL